MAAHTLALAIHEPARSIEDTLPVLTERFVRPEPEPEAVAYAWPETPPTGLRKFNLGTIPASVTPPRTWRKAAWFAVGTAAFVVCALGFATYALVGKPRGAPIEALPGQPTQQLLITNLPGDRTGTTTASTRPSTRPPTTSPSRSATQPRQEADRSVGPTGDLTARPGIPATPGGTPAPAPATSPPARNTVAMAPAATTDPQQLGDRTEQYFAQVVDNPKGACELTTGSMRAEGPEGIEARYVNVARVEIKAITIDPNWSFTRSTVVLVRKDGARTTAVRELTFTRGADPRITTDSAA